MLAAGGIAVVVGLTTLAVAQVRSGGLTVGPGPAVTAGASAPLATLPAAEDETVTTRATGTAGETASRTATRTAISARARNRAVTRAVTAALAGRRGVVDVAIADAAGHQIVHVGEGTPVRTASIVKLLVLRALQARGDVTQREKVLATRMVTRSDNAATSALWRVTGGTGGIARAVTAAGMTHTVRTNPRAQRWDGWRTTAEDQVKLLRSITRGRGDDDRWTRSLMGQVIDTQDWGVGSVPGAVGVKNGWLPVDDGWIVNTDGCVEKGGHTLCVSVLSTGSRSFAAGIHTVELAAAAAVRAWG